MKNRSIKNIFSQLKKLSKSDTSKRKLSFKFESEFLDYQPYLKNFSSRHYKLFEELAHKLNLQDSINDLFNGEIVNKTENRQALHHQYRNNQTALEFNFKKITEPFIKRIKKDGFKITKIINPCISTFRIVFYTITQCGSIVEVITSYNDVTTVVPIVSECTLTGKSLRQLQPFCRPSFSYIYRHMYARYRASSDHAQC